MNPIFKEYSEFLENKTGLKLQEGYYWLDRQIIKGFNKDGEIIKLYRLYVNKDFSITYKKYKTECDLISWQELIKAYDFRDIEEKSLELIRQSSKGENVILSSTGKDSMLVTHLVRKIFPQAKIVFNNTSLDCADTYKMVKSLDNAIILNPKEGFYQWRKTNNFIPTRFGRACCSIFKEGVFKDTWDKNKITTIYMGMRNGESTTRASYTDYWKNKIWPDTWQGVLPIREWSELDVWLYTLKNKIPINPKYKKGYSRVGCAIACPYYNLSTWVLDKYFYSSLFDRWQNILKEDFINNNKDLILNCTLEEYMTSWPGGRVREVPNNEVIEGFAKRNNLDFNVAAKYFNKKCHICGRIIKPKNVIGMNLKYFGRNTNKFLCKKCFIKEQNIDKDKWDEIIETFKSQGCDLI